MKCQEYGIGIILKWMQNQRQTPFIKIKESRTQGTMLNQWIDRRDRQEDSKKKVVWLCFFNT